MGADTFYRWKRLYGGLQREELQRVRVLEEENRRLKRLIADQALNLQLLQNLYAYVGNNPVAYTDPFGLKVCVKGKNAKETQRLRNAVQDGTDTDITWGDDGCVESFKARGHEGFEKMQAGFRHLVFTDRVTFNVSFTPEYTSTQHDPLIVSVFYGSEGLPYKTGPLGRCDGGVASMNVPQVMAHELVHHFPVAFGKPMNSDENEAIATGDNPYNRANNRPERCQHNPW
jgi:hypothetical protein